MVASTSGIFDNDELATAAATPHLDTEGSTVSTDTTSSEGGNASSVAASHQLPDVSSSDGAQGQYQPGLSQRTLLSDPLDETHLSSLLCHVRSQVEYFPASAEDVVARNKKGGSKHPLTLGRVGLRCAWCAHLPHEERANGAVAYPNSIRLVHQAVRNWQRHHLPICPHIPQTIKDMKKSLVQTRKHSATDSIRYWTASCGRKGMSDSEKEGTGIRLRGVDYSHVDNPAVGSPAVDGGTSLNATKKKPAKKKRTRKPKAEKKSDVARVEDKAVVGVEAAAAQGVKIETWTVAEQLPDVAPSSSALGSTNVAGFVELDAISLDGDLDVLGDLGRASDGNNDEDWNKGEGEIESMPDACSHRASPAADTDEALVFNNIPYLDDLELGEGEAIADIFGDCLGSTSAPATANVVTSPIASVQSSSPNALAELGVNSTALDETNGGNQAQDSRLINIFGAQLEPVPLREPDSLRAQSRTEGSRVVNMSEAQLEPTPLQEPSSRRRRTGGATAPKREQSEKLIQKVHLAYSMVQAAGMILHLPETEGVGAIDLNASPDLLGNEGLMPGQTASHNQSDAQKELRSLGVELYELFAGAHPFVESDESDGRGDGGSNASNTFPSASAVHDSDGSEEEQQTKREKKSTAGSYTPLRELGFPVLLCSLVSNLLGNGGGTSGLRSYQSIDQVKEDLRLMTVDHDRYLFDPDVGRTSSLGGKISLEFPKGKLYGRNEQSSCLVDAYNRVICLGGACEMFLVSGSSGTGKSSLVQQVRGPLSEEGGYFISAKFDEMGQVLPLSAIANAFNEYCDTLTESDAVSSAQIQTSIKEAVGSDGKVLTDLIPNLCKVIGQPDPDQAMIVEGTMALNRLMFIFRKFLRAISSTAHPIVLFLDDLQWADGASLELITSLVTDAEIKSFLFLGCYRDSEVSEEHLLTAQLATIQQAGVRVSTINVDNMERDDVNELISETLRLLPHQTELLSYLVYSKTSGNALFVVQFLRSLCDEGLLNYSLASQRWEWDMEAILSKKVADNVVDLMTSKMLKLPAEVLWSLKLAACLGCQCDQDIISLLDIEGVGESNDGSSNAMANNLDVAVREGMMFKIKTTYKFSHDQIQHAAYSLIQSTSTGPAALHLKIGRTLVKKSSAANIDSIIFVLVDQLHRGESLIVAPEEKTDLTHLYLLAGKKAISSSAFQPASVYLLQGIALLDESHWSTHYDLSLEMFSRCAETYYVTGNLDRVSVIANTVLQHGRSLRDKVPAYYSLAESLASQGKLLDGINCCLGVLSKLGESFPDHPCKADVVKEFTKTRCMLERTTVNDIARQAVEMDDSDTVAAMKFLTLVVLYTFQSNQELMSLAIFRMVQLSLSSGVSKESPYAFAAFSFILCKVDEYGLGHQFGKLALTLMEKSKAKHFLARVYCTVYSLVNTFTEPVQACISSLKYGHEVGMSTGDIEWAFWAANRYVATGFFNGLNLELLIAESGAYIKQMKEYKCENAATATLVPLQASLNLVGSPDDATVLTGEAMNQDELMNYVLETKNAAVEGQIYFVRMILAYMFGRHDLAAELVERRRIFNRDRPVRNASVVPETFYMGLIAAEIARSEYTLEDSSWRQIAYDAREKMQSWAEHSSWNFQHKLELLDAEIAYLNDDLDKAARSYDEAIRIAGEHRFVHEQALASERAAIYYSGLGDEARSTDYYNKSRQFYLEWGAKRKAQELDRFCSERAM